jgi:DNA-directed RNA polymerase subunit beta
MNDLIITPHLAINAVAVEHNDATRLQMSSSQARQAVALVNNEIPIVQSTLETATLDQNLFSPDLYIAKNDGKVIFSSNNLCVIEYDNSEFDYFRTTYLHKNLPTGTTFKAGDVITYKKNYFIGTTLAQGVNLLTSVSTHPYAFEDAIVISESAREKLKAYMYDTIVVQLKPKDQILLSIDTTTEDYVPFPTIGQKFKANVPFLIVKDIGARSIFNNPKTYSYNRDVEIVDVKVFPVTWERSVREFDVKMKQFQYQRNNIAKKVSSFKIPEKIKTKILEVESLFDNKKVLYKKEKLAGVYIVITYRYIEDVNLGDKFSNRHANKGTISKILEDKEMPTLEDGTPAEIIVSPMSIISRMNIGQLFESLASSNIYYLKKKLQNLSFDDGRDLVYRFYQMMDNTDEKLIINTVKNWLANVSYDELVTNYYTYPIVPFHSPTKEQLLEQAKLVGNPIKHGPHKLHMGHMYFYRLVHIARHKFASRSVGLLDKKTLQPVSGRNKNGGQRFGEMEVWNLLAHNSISTLREMLTVKSDDIPKKISYILEQIYGSQITLADSVPESVKLLESYFNILGVKLVYDLDMLDI